jgi:AraC-like DNA-binding protein
MKSAFYEDKADINDYLLFDLQKGGVTNAHFHNSLEIVFVKSGRHRIGINGVERVLGAGEIAVSNSYDIHYYIGEGSSQKYVLLLGQNYSGRFNLIYENKKFDSFLPARGEGTEKIFGLLEQFYKAKGDLNYLMTYGYINMLFGLMAKYYPLSVKPERSNSVVVDILTYINQNYTGDITLESVAKKFGYSKNYFSTLFNRYTNMHFRDYVNRLRIVNIRSLLEDKKADNNTITEIALSNGFDSLNTFYRAMKKFG